MSCFGRLLAVAVLALLLGSAVDAGAVPLTFTASSGSKSAAVTFDVSGTNLIVRLANTSSADALVPTDILTGVFFTIAGNPLLTKESVVLDSGSTVEHGGTTDPGNAVGGEWAYLNGLSQYGANEGISSSGLGIFGPGDLFPGTNLFGPLSPDGLQYGLAPAGDNPTTGNSGTADPLIKNSVLIMLGGLAGGFSLSSISNVTFQYGTALTEPHVSVPEPGVLELLTMGMGLALVAAAMGRRRRAA